ncbi:MAG: IS66 family insertion sequence element accessory protein TnpA [Oceanipulchritudo sp.]
MELIEPEVMEDPSKRDSRSRRIVKAQERDRLIREYESSGLTQKAFCRSEGINLHTFVSWLGKRKGPGKAAKPKEPVFEEVFLSAGPGRPVALEVQLPGGEIVRGSEPAAVAKLVGLLRG